MARFTTAPGVGERMLFEVRGLPDGPHRGVANLGIRPSANQLARPLLEVHLFDFDADIYGTHLNVRSSAGETRPQQNDGRTDYAQPYPDPIGGQRPGFFYHCQPGDGRDDVNTAISGVSAACIRRFHLGQ